MSGPDNDSKLNADLVLRRAFDVASGKLKVDAEVTATIGEVDVVIDAAGGDNIAISDGTDVMSVNADGSINVVPSLPSGASTSALQTSANTKLDTLNTSLNFKPTTRLDEVSATVTYIGEATAGSATSSAVWLIKKIDETSGIIVTFADGNTNYDNVWDNRAALTYS